MERARGAARAGTAETADEFLRETEVMICEAARTSHRPVTHDRQDAAACIPPAHHPGFRTRDHRMLLL